MRIDSVKPLDDMAAVHAAGHLAEGQDADFLTGYQLAANRPQVSLAVKAEQQLPAKQDDSNVFSRIVYNADGSRDMVISTKVGGAIMRQTIRISDPDYIRSALKTSETLDL